MPSFFTTLKQKVSGYLRPGTGYSAAFRFIRRLKNWKTSQGSPDGEVLLDLPTLRQRSRDLYKNNAIGRGAIRLLVSDVIGRGLKLQSSIDRAVIGQHNGWTAEETEIFCNGLEPDIERKFKWWAESTEADARGQMNFYEITSLVFNSILQSGEVFISLPLRKFINAPFRVRVGLIEADQVSNPLGYANSRVNRDGVVTTEEGIALGYWVNKNQEIYPEDYEYVPRYGEKSGRPLLLHLYKADRPGQSRGVPLLSPVIEVIKNLDEYKKSELDAAVISSFFSVFIKSDNPNALDGNGIIGQFGDQPDSEIEEQGQDYNLAPGAIMQLLPGEDIVTANPARPNTSYEGFVVSLMRETGMALGIPYEMLIRHFTSSYSASRAARVEFEKEIKVWREWIKLRFCLPVYREWFIEEVISGRIQAPGFFESQEVQMAYLASSWSGEAMGQIEPLKEVDAAIKRVNEGFSTRTEEAAAMMGNDYTTNLQILRREKDTRDKLGLQSPDEIDKEASAEPEIDLKNLD